jgi:multidrug efflux system membrane fusion protein
VKYAVQCVCLLILAASSLSMAGCNKSAPVKAEAPPPPEVFVTLPTTAEITDFEDFTGRTKARQTIEIRPRVTGYIDKIHFKDGGEVKEGEVLFEIDPRPYQRDVERAAATLEQAQAHLKRLEHDFERASNLIASKQISREQYDLVVGDRAESEAAVRVATANLGTANLHMSYTKVRPKVAGRISRTQFDPGNLVKADESILTTLVTLDPMYAYFEVDERTLLMMRRYVEQGKIQTGEDLEVPVLMGLADEEGFPHRGTINFVDNQLDVATGTLQVRGTFPNPNHMLAPGLFVRVRLPIGDPYEAILIDEQALGTDQGQKFVYVVDKDSKAQYRRVQVGKLQNGRRVILKGLDEGERVVVSGLQRVRPGSEVTAKPAENTAQTESGAGGVAKTETGLDKLSHQ